MRDIQSTLEGPPKKIKRPQPMVLQLETIDEDHSLKQHVEAIQQNFLKEDQHIEDPQTLHKELWDDIQPQKWLRDSFFDSFPPVSIVGSSYIAFIWLNICI